MRQTIVETYNRGGVTTVAWHFSNPVSNNGFYWKGSVSAPAVRYIIPGGIHHEGDKKILKDIAELFLSVKGKDGKLAAFTETGLESIPDTAWWTDVLLKALKTENLRLSYVLVWRNDIRSATHYYAPFPGHLSVPDFMKFYRDPFTSFEEDLNGLYR